MRVPTQPRTSLPLPFDIEMRYGSQRAYRATVFDRSTNAAGEVVESAIDITNWDFDVDFEWWDGTSDTSQVLLDTERSDPKPAKHEDVVTGEVTYGNALRISKIDAANGRIAVDLLSALCPVNPQEGEHIIAFVYLRVSDHVTPNPNVFTRRLVISYTHNADFS